MKKDVGSIVDFLFEVGILAETPRSGFFFLGSGKQSVAEHICRDVFIGYVLAQMENEAGPVRDRSPQGGRSRPAPGRRVVSNGVDTEKVLKMCLFHDLAEARTSDLNYVHQKYAKVDDKRAVKDLSKTIPFGDDVQEVIDEYRARRTKEAKLAKDADNIEWILSLKEQVDTGNVRAKTWIPSAVKRLKTKSAQLLASRIIKTDSDNWWFADKDDEWWVKRAGK